MSIITITDGPFGCGDMLARRLVDLLGYPYFGEEALIQAVQHHRLEVIIPAKMFELEPPWWKRLRENYRIYRIALQAAMCDIAELGSFVYRGIAGQELLPVNRQILRIFLVVAEDYRIQQIRMAKGLTGEEARRWLAKTDKITDRRFKAIFGVSWRDPSRYDVVLNIARFGVDTTAHMIADIIRQAGYQPTFQSEREFQDYLLESRIRAALLVSAKTRRMDLGLQVNGGGVHVSGFLFPVDFDFKGEILRVIREIPGVDKVTSDIRLLPDDDSVPVIPRGGL